MNTLNELVEQFRTARQNYEAAKEIVANLEKEILAQVESSLTKGTNKIGDLKIVCANYEKWDQEKLAAVRLKWPKNIQFPFVAEYKPEAKQISYFKNMDNGEWKLLSEAVSYQPKKPYFTLDKDKSND